MRVQRIRETIKDFYYKYLQKCAFFRTLVLICKITARGEWIGEKNMRPSWHREAEARPSLEQLRIAIICDDMTWKNFQGICELVYLTPDNWFDELERTKPDIFFCESAWYGISEHAHCWEGRIAHNVGVWLENRLTLKRILAYCHAAGISTVFWNKEDPHSDRGIYHFTDTAYLFDHICTTAREQIAQYQAHGHKSVHFLPFGFSPRLFYPIEEPGEENTAVFFGSWYQDFPQRCADTRFLLDTILKQGIKLTIYDRNSEANDPARMFPEEYQPYVRKAVGYEDIRGELKKYQYAVNLNTETESETMFARRVFEIMACGRLIISNTSVGLRKLFPSSIWYLGEPFALENADSYIRQNQEFVFRECTMEHQLLRFMTEIGLLAIQNIGPDKD